MALYALSLMAARDGTTFEKLTGGYGYADLSRRALLDAEFAARLNAKMWTAAATDGRKMKVATLYNHIKAEGFDGFIAPTKVSAVFDRAATWRRAQNPANDGTKSRQQRAP